MDQEPALNRAHQLSSDFEELNLAIDVSYAFACSRLLSIADRDQICLIDPFLGLLGTHQRQLPTFLNSQTPMIKALVVSPYLH